MVPVTLAPPRWSPEALLAAGRAAGALFADRDDGPFGADAGAEAVVAGLDARFPAGAGVGRAGTLEAFAGDAGGCPAGAFFTGLPAFAGFAVEAFVPGPVATWAAGRAFDACFAALAAAGLETRLVAARLVVVLVAVPFVGAAFLPAADAGLGPPPEVPCPSTPPAALAVSLRADEEARFDA